MDRSVGVRHDSKLPLEAQNRQEELMPEELELAVKVDGKSLEMLPFVQEMVAATVLAVVGTLKGAEQAREIQVTVRRKS
jgi:hypothetical protein